MAADASPCRTARAAALLTALILLLCGCSHKEDTLREHMRRIASDERLQNEQGLDMLCSAILADPDAYRAYIRPDGNIDLTKLSADMRRTAAKSDPDFSWDAAAYGAYPRSDLRLNLYLERSGSMTGYDARTTSGDFKRTLNELANRFPHAPGADGSIYIVNDAVYPYDADFARFVREKDIFSATRGLGNPAYTDFGAIFEYVLRDTVPENINVLITDLIYSPRDTKGVTPAKIFNEEESLATAIFRRHPDKSVAVVKLQGDFDGMYYPYNSPAGGVRYKGKRPYYAVITGSAAAIYKLLHDPRYASFTDFASLPGYSDEYIFSQHELPLSYYTLLPKGKGARGSYTLAPGQDTRQAHTLRDVKPDKTGEITFRIAADLSAIPADPDRLLDPEAYIPEGSTAARVIQVEKVTPEMIDPRTRRYLSDATHLLTVSALPDRMTGKEMVFYMDNPVPAWVKKSQCDDDSRPGPGRFASTTFGVGHLLQGVYNAYHAPGAARRLFSIRIATE